MNSSINGTVGLKVDGVDVVGDFVGILVALDGDCVGNFEMRKVGEFEAAGASERLFGEDGRAVDAGKAVGTTGVVESMAVGRILGALELSVGLPTDGSSEGERSMSLEALEGNAELEFLDVGEFDWEVGDDVPITGADVGQRLLIG